MAKGTSAIVAPPGRTTLHAHNEPEPFKADDLDDATEYEVTLTRTVEFAKVLFQPDHHHLITGAFIKTLMNAPGNEGAISAATKAPS